jgi:hypothetical protein
MRQYELTTLFALLVFLESTLAKITPKEVTFDSRCQKEEGARQKQFHHGRVVESRVCTLLSRSNYDPYSSRFKQMKSVTVEFFVTPRRK